MENEFKERSEERNEDTANLIILVFIAFLLGVYLIATTVLVAQDGIFYIERAQKLSSNPRSVVTSHPPGYPFLIFIALKFVGLFNSSPSAQTWAYTAQSMTLLCRLLAIIPLYFIGKLLVGPRNSFWALLILILLPYPARFGSDVLRDWPHILFLAVGFLLLLRGSKDGKWWMFGIAGLSGGLGHIIRPECAQLVVYGILWLLIRLFLPTRKMSRPKLVCALFVLLFGFAVPVMPYMKVRGRILPVQLKALIASSVLQSDKNQKLNIADYNGTYVAAGVPGNIVKALGKLIVEIGDNLMYFFFPAMLIGFYYRFHKQSLATTVERFFVPVFIVLNVIMMILLHYSQGYISRRHCLPLVVFSIFYVPIGLQIFAEWLSNRFTKGCLENNPKPQLWFFILVAVGVTICLPKLARPLRIEKKGYRDAAKWLKENTAEEDLIAVPDHRIGFYAERERCEYEIWEVTKRVKYIVKISKAEDDGLNIPKNIQVQEVYSVWLDKWKYKRKLVIYKTM